MKKISSLLTVLALIFALGAFLPEDVLKAKALDDITGLFCDSTNKVLSWNSYDIDAEYRVDIDSNTFTDTRSYTVQDTRFPFGDILSQKGVVYHFTVTAINQDAEAVSNPAKKAYANTTTLTGVEINKDLILSWHPIRGEVEKYRVNLYTPNMQCCFGLETSTGTSVDLTEQLKGAPSGKYSATVEAVVFVDGESVITGLSDTYKFDYNARSKVIDTTYAIVTEPVAGEHPDETAQLILNGGDFDTEDCVSSCEVKWYEVTVGADSTNYIKPTDVFEADKNYMDYYERALYNHILSILNPVQGGFVYFTPMRSGHYRVYSQPQTSMWCCVGTGLENPARYGEMIYAHEGNDLIVNLFIPSTLTWDGMTVKQENRFPQEPATNITLQLKKARKFAVKIRKPAWCDAVQLAVNGSPADYRIAANGYLVIERSWKDGDQIHMDMPMHLTAMTTPDGKPQYSFLYGPIVLAAKTGTDRQDGLFADDSRGGHIANGPKVPQAQMPAIIGTPNDVLSHLKAVEGQPLTFTLTGLTTPAYEGLRLVPFYQLYECRYQIYFPLYSQSEWAVKQQEMAAAEKAKMEMEANTVDKVFCGEQQSESDHFFKADNAWNGYDEGMHWRTARGSFSYQMKAQDAKTLRLQGFSAYERVIVSIDGQQLDTVRLDGQGLAVLNLPATLQKETIMLTLSAEPGKQTPRIHEIRLCK